MKKNANLFSEGAAAQYLEACRSQFEGRQALVHTLLASAERLRSMQLAAAHEIQARHAEIAGKITKVSSMQDLLELQRTLMTQYCQDAVSYWTRLAELTQQTQAEIAGMVQEQSGSVLKQALAETPAPSAAGTPDALASVMKTALDAAREANESFVKALTGAYLPAAAAKKSAKTAAAQPARD